MHGREQRLVLDLAVTQNSPLTVDLLAGPTSVSSKPPCATVEQLY